MTPAGRRDRTIVFERATNVADDHGGEVPTWAPLVSAAAAVRHGTSAERRDAAAERGSQAATFRVLSTAATRGVLVTDRIAFDGSAWDIEGIAQVTRAEIEFSGVRSR